MTTLNKFATFCSCFTGSIAVERNWLYSQISPLIKSYSLWFLSAYTIAKYGMSMCVLGMAEEFKGEIAVNALWPKTGMYLKKYIHLLVFHLLSLTVLRCILGG